MMAHNISAPTTATGSSRKPPMENPVSMNATETIDWELRESQRQRELEEARARAAQMEKTMKWWSDCTANWRDKWSKVRNELNKSREETRQLRTLLDSSQKDGNECRREKGELEIQIVQLKKEIEKVHVLMLKHANQISNKNDEMVKRDGESPDTSERLKNVNSEDGLVTEQDINDTNEAGRDKPLQLMSKEDENEFLEQRVSVLQLRLDEEREEKKMLHINFEKYQREYHEIHAKCEELRMAKQDAVRELLTLQEQHRAELRITSNTLQDELCARENLEKRLCDLRTELEKLQSENAAEWAKGERLETEKQTMERENKKLRAEIQDIQDRLERKGRPIVNSDVEIRSLQQELADKSKEIVDLKHSNNKMKKMLAEANTEVGHAVRRAEQYEAEVKRLRTRVEDLKREIATIEDDLDAASTAIRRLQRANEELVSQNESMRVEYAQLQHLQSRNTNSPKHFKSKLGLPHEYKPNIHELKQLFDDSKRSNGAQMTSHQRLYTDAKPTKVDTDLGGVNQIRQRNAFNFEKAKQKFDNAQQHRRNTSRSVSSSVTGGDELKNYPPSNIPKRTYDPDPGSVLQALTSPFEDKLPKNSFSMTGSINLDGLKVSDDE